MNEELTPDEEMMRLESIGNGPFYLLPFQVDICIARFGRLPKNSKPYPQIKIFPEFPVYSKPPRGAQWKRELNQKRK